MPFIQTSGLRIHYEQAGSGAQTLLLVHGNFASSRWWKGLLDTLPPGWQGFAPDLRGCGASDKPFEGYEVGQLAGDLAAFAGELGLERFHVVGHSLGGAVALQLALDEAPRLQSLILAAPTPAEGLATHLERSPEDLFSWNGLSRWLPALSPERSLLDQLLSHSFPLLPGGVDPHALADDALRVSPAAVAGFMHGLEAWNVEAQLEKIHVPVLIIGGGKDPLIPPEALARTAEKLPEAQLEIWPDSAHTPFLEHPNRFRERLAVFLEWPE